MKKSDKKVLIIILVVFLLSLGLLAILGRKEEEKSKSEANEVSIKAREVLEVYNYENTVSIKKDSNVIASKYKLGKYKTYETVKETEFGETKGKVLFIRTDDMNANIYQTKKKIVKGKEDNPELNQINEYMRLFKQSTMMNLEISEETEPKVEKLYGKSQYGFPIPTEESIYVEKRLYSLTYEVEEDNIYSHKEDNSTKMQTYDLNFYMNGEYFVCELVRFF